MKKIDVSNLKGVFDYVGKEEIIRNKIKATLKNNFEKYGYSPVETPALYNYDILAYKYDDDAEILNEMYTLTDQGKRHLALRYDLTMPFCKLIANTKELRLPFKRYEIGKVFRNGPVKTGRNREFYQCDVDVVGLDNRYIELEEMQLVVDTFKELNIDINIKWNNRKLMSGLLEYLQINSIEKSIQILDKMEKITHEELIKEFQKININEEKAEELLKLFSMNIEQYNEKFKDTDNTLIKEGLSEINEINKNIPKLHLEENTTFTPTLARGLSIYTGIVFEFFDKKQRLTCSLGGGGRYNKIITEFIDDGTAYPAVGLSFGLEPIYAILKETMMTIKQVDVYVVPMNTEIECLSLARELRNNNIKVEVELKQRKIKKSFEYASKENIKYVLVVGENEIKEGKYTLKNMDKQEQQLLTIDEVIKELKSNN